MKFAPRKLPTAVAVAALAASLVVVAPPTASAQGGDPTPTGTTLVSNSDPSNRFLNSVRANSRAQGFTTGSNAGGYTLERIVGLTNVSVRQPDKIHPELWSATPQGRPDSKLADLSGPARNTTGTGHRPVEFVASSGILLAPDTTYFLVLHTDDSFHFQFLTTGSKGEDDRSAEGWGIANTHLRLDAVDPSSPGDKKWQTRSPGRFGTDLMPFVIDVKGTANPPPPLVSNTDQDPQRFQYAIGRTAWSQGFTTGDNAGGYTLASIEARTAYPIPSSGLNAELWAAASGGGPGSRLASLSVPADEPAGVVNFTAPENTTLAANTTYYFVLWRTDAQQFFSVQITGSDDEHLLHAPGWSIADHPYSQINKGRQPDPNWVAISGGSNLLMAVWGDPLPPPPLVSNLGPDPDSGAVDNPAFATAQGFTTGPSAAGYSLTSVEAHLAAALTAAQGSKLRAELWSAASDGGPGSLIASLAVPTKLPAGTVSFAAPEGTTLAASTSYYLVLYTIDPTVASFSLTKTVVPIAGAAGWSIEGSSYDQFTPSYLPDSTAAWSESMPPVLQIGVTGAAVPTVTLSTDSGGSVAESAGRVTVTATLSEAAAPAGGVDVTLTALPESTAEAGAAEDYTVAGTVNVAQGSTTATTTLIVNEDTDVEADETVVLRAAAPGYTAAGDLTITITDDDLAAQPTGVTVTGRGSALDLSWTAPAGVLSGYDVHYTSASDTVAVPDTAAVRTDRDDTAGWVDAAHTGTTASHSISGLTNDTDYRVRIRAQSAAGAGAWAHDSGTPEAPTVTLSSGAGSSVAESVGTVTITATLSEAATPAGGVTVTLTAQPASTAEAGAGKDYTLTGTITVAQGATTGTATLTVNDDTDVEAHETLVLSAAADGHTAGADLTVTIRDDDTAAKPTGVTVTATDTQLDLAWTAPAGVLTGYDVHYTSASDTGAGAVLDDATVRADSDAAAGWVDAGHTGTMASLSISSLTNGTEYRVRIRAQSAAGAGAWAHDAGTPEAPAATLVSNLGQSLVGNVSTDGAATAQPFTTGSNAGGYTLSSIDLSPIRAYSSSEALRVELWSTDSSGVPSSKLASLTVPSSLTKDTQSFAAPADTLLSANTTYAVVWHTGNHPTAEYRMNTTSGDEEDDGKADGWSIGNQHRYRQFAEGETEPSSDNWTRDIFQIVKIRVTGTAVPTVTLSSDDADNNVAESAGSVTITATLTEPAPEFLGADVLLTSETASTAYSGRDYRLPGLIYVAPGETVGTTTLTIVDDSDVEAHETVVLSAAADGHTAGTLTFTISDDDRAAKPAAVTVTARSTALDLTWTAPVGLLSGYDVHYTSASDTVAVPDDAAVRTDSDDTAGWVDAAHTGTTASHTITSLTNDTDYRVRIRAQSAAGAGAWEHDTGTPEAATVTLSSDDADNNVAESAGTVTITATLSEAATPAGGVTVTLTAEAASTAEAGAGKDYTLTGTITVAQNSTTGTTTLTVNDDTDVEAHETLVLSAAADGHTSSGDLTITITDDDLAAKPTAVTVTAADAQLDLAWTAPEGVLSGYDVHYTSASDTVAVPDTATVRTDSDDTAGWVDATHTGTTASHTITSLTNDTDYRVRIRAQSAAGAGVWEHGTGTPEAPTVTLSSGSGNSVAESVGTVTITATLSEAATPAGGVTVTLTAEAASTAEAGAGKDYTLAGTITVAQNSTTGTATLTVNDDSDVEAHETLVLSAAADGHTAGGDLTITITDDDTAAKPTAVTVTAADAQLDLAWTAPDGLLTGYDVHYTSAPKNGSGAVTDTADVRTDSDDTAGWVDANHTGTTASHSITGLTNDTDYRVRIRAQSAAGAGAWAHDTGTPEAPTVTLSTDDADNNVAESVGTVTITATLSEAATPPGGITVTLTAESASTAEAGAAKDYTLVGTITVAQGATTGTATLTVNDDSEVEAHETLVLSAAADGHTSGTDLTVTITDNDTAAKPTGVTVTAADAQLDLAWTAPAGLLSGYDVHYTSAPKSGNGAVTDTADVRTDTNDTAGWVDATHTGLTASHSISGLDNGTEYRVRIRAQSAAGAGAWEHGTGTPEAPPLPTVTLSSDDADDNVAESAGTVTITATLSQAATPAGGITVTVTREAASTAEAGAGKDYTLTGTITVAQGSTTGTATLTVNDDSDVEAHETLVLSAAADGHTSGADLTITISDDDTAAKPTGVTVTAADAQLDLAWTAPAGLLSGYDVHYTSAPKSGNGAVTDTADVRTDSDDTAGWVDAAHTGTTASHSITSLDNDTEYRIRIRAQSAAGAGAWEHGTGTPEAPPLPTVTLSSDDADDNVAESVGTVTITATLSEAATPAGGMTVTLTAETASTAEAGAGKDYTLTGTITVAQGSTTGTATLTVNDDSDVEAHETLVLSAAADGHTSGTDLTITITDDDTAAKPTGVTVTAADAQLDLVWTAPAGVLTGYDVHYTSAPKSGNGAVTDTADVRTDSDDTAGWVDAAHTGTTASHSISSLTNDTEYRIRIRAQSAAGAGAWEHGTGTPEAPPLPTVTLSSDDADNNIAESVGTVTITATLSEAATPAGGITVTVTREAASTAEAGAGKDYTLAGTITVAQNSTTGTATLTVNDDSDVEAHETLVLSAAADGHTSGTDLTVTITDNDTAAKPTAVTVTAADAQLDLAWTAPEGVLSGYDVHYTSASDTVAVPDNATVRTDTNAAAGWVDANHTGTTASHSITGLTNDTDYRVRIRAQSAAGAGAWAHDTGTPEAPTVTLSTDDADNNVAESVGTVTITATLSQPATPAGGVTVTLTAQPTSTAEAGAAKDYTLVGTITVAQGSTTGTATLTVNDDSDVEAHETLVLSAAADGHTSSGDLTITITDDDTAAKPTGVTVTAADAQLDLAWTAPAGVLTGYDVHYTSAPKSGNGAVTDTADVRTDSDDTAGWVDAAHTGTTASHTITSLTNDTDYRVRIRATSAAGAGAWEHGTGTPEAPTDDGLSFRSDTETTVTVNGQVFAAAAYSVTEGDTVTVELRLPAAETEAVRFQMVPDYDSVADFYTDYSIGECPMLDPNDDSISDEERAEAANCRFGAGYVIGEIPAGETSFTYEIRTEDDDEVEGDESFTLNIFPMSWNADLGAVPKAVVTIVDNDMAAEPGVVVTLPDVVVDGVTQTADKVHTTEGSSGSYTIVLASQPESWVRIYPESAMPCKVSIRDRGFVEFTPRNWDIPQTVRARAWLDYDAADEETVITHRLEAPDSPSYQTVTRDPVTNEVTDTTDLVSIDDVTVAAADKHPAGVMVVTGIDAADETHADLEKKAVTDLTLITGGTTGYLVYPATEPAPVYGPNPADCYDFDATRTITVTATSSDPTVATVSPVSVTFGPGTDYTPVTFTVTAVGAGTAQITHSTTDSSDPDYAAITVHKTVGVTVAAPQQGTQDPPSSPQNADPPTAVARPDTILPGPVHGVTVTADTPDSLTITWEPPTTGDAPTRYIVHLKPRGGGKGWTKTPKASKTKVTFTKLQPDTTYRLFVRAKNKAGKGPRTHTRITLPHP